MSYLKDKLSERSLGLKLNLNIVSLKGFLSQLKESRAKFVQCNKKFRQLNWDHPKRLLSNEEVDLSSQRE